ncbi:hypothetical protein [Streptomyces sp. NPDC021622]|uniref:hypothetical protein n=1 Tax=Streptomyces sp. NPDC021622 TaxID=3155013 RepID=UPI0033D11AB3
MAIGDPVRTDVFSIEMGTYRVATYASASGLNLATDVMETGQAAPNGNLLPEITFERPTPTPNPTTRRRT